MKKFLRFVPLMVLLLVLVLLLPQQASAATSGYYTYTVSGGKATITDVDTSISGDVTIPSTLGGYPVTSIGSHAFYDCDSLTSVTIGDSVTSIGAEAFYNCTGLTSVTIGDSVTSIGSYAFYSCYRLTGIWVDEENPAYCSDEYGVLYNKDKTTLIQAPCGIQGSYTIPDSVTSIGNYAFAYCDSLTSITIGDSVTSIGDGAFSSCASLTSVTIPGSVTAISDYAFFSCTSLTSITIGDSVTSIGDGAFSSCASLTSVTIGDSVTAISDYAFRGCTSLTSVTIGDSVTSIGWYAFYDCDSLASVTIPDSVTSIGFRAFYDCDSLKHVAYGGTSAQWSKISISSSNTSLTGASVWHYGATQDDVYYTKNCINAGLFCSLCNDFITKEKAESGTHVYESGADTYCDDCGYTRTVKSFYVSTKPTQKEIPLLTGEVDTTGGKLRVTYSDSTYGYIDMTNEMVNGFDNRVYGQQTLTVTYGGCTATYTVQCVAASTPDKLEILTQPNRTSYLMGQSASLTGLTLKATYGDVVVELPGTAATMDTVDMTTAGVKTVTVRFYDAAVSFPIYVHEKQTQTIDSALYPESAHNYAASTNETKTFTYPGAGSLVLTFSSQSFTESNYDFVYILDGAGAQIGKYSGSLAGKVVTVPGDTVQIKLTSDSSVNKYGYAFSSIVAETILHPGELFCEICGESKLVAGQTAALTEDMTLAALTIPTDTVLDLNGKVLTVESLASFGEIIDSVGGGGLIASNIEMSGNDWLPVKDASGCYRFYEYEQESLGTKTTSDGVSFGFALDFVDETAYTTLLESNDVQITITLDWGSGSKDYAFSRELVAKYVDWVRKYPSLQPAMQLSVTGLDSLADGTVITVTPYISAVGGKIQTTGEAMTYKI